VSALPEDLTVAGLHATNFNWLPVDYVHANRFGVDPMLLKLARAGNARARQMVNRTLLRVSNLASTSARVQPSNNWVGRPLMEFESGVRRLAGCMLSSAVIRALDKIGVDSILRLLGADGRKQSILDNAQFPALSAWGLDVCSNTETLDLLVLGGSALMCSSCDTSDAFCDRFQLAFPNALLRLNQPSQEVVKEIQTVMAICSTLSRDLP
jgi:hypothetical protein